MDELHFGHSRPFLCCYSQKDKAKRKPVASKKILKIGLAFEKETKKNLGIEITANGSQFSPSFKCI